MSYADPGLGSSRVGAVLAGKYRLEELLGLGGMAHVFRAVSVDAGRRVTIKLLREGASATTSERFVSEARAAMLVRHPHVIDVLDIGKAEDGTPFIVEELLEGESLRQYAKRAGGKIPVDDVAALMPPVIAAIGHAHAQGAIHRDIKPESVFVATVDGKRIAKLLELGISKTTAENVKLGTPAYMAPEQIEALRNTDARSDVWALGVLLFEIVSGKLPFDGPDAPSIFAKIATTEAPALESVAPFAPASLSRVVARCLQKSPAARYPNAAELARDLEAVRPMPAPLTTPGEMTLPGKPAALSRGVVGGGKLVEDERSLGTADTVPHDFPVADSQRLLLAARANPLPAAGLPPSQPKTRTERMAPLPPRPENVGVTTVPATRRAVSPWRAPLAIAMMVGGFALLPILLFLVFHRSAGWPIARIVVAGSPLAAAVVQAALGSVAAAFAVARGAGLLLRMRAGAPPTLARVALESAFVGVAAFAAIEFLTAMVT